MKKLILSIFLFSLMYISFAQVSKNPVNEPPVNEPAGSNKVYSQPGDRIIFDKYVEYIKDKTDLPTDQIIIETAKFFLGVPYVANTLEIEPEGLVINLRELDCTTFVETVYALSMMVRSKDLTFDIFCNKLKWLRYRDGVINDYTDRLHYTSDWMYTNQKKGIVKIITDATIGDPLNLNLYIMSSNTDKYKQLKGNAVLIDKIKEKEAEINTRKYYYLPTAKIDINRDKIESGDIVGFVTTIPGIDISHVGIIYKEGEMLTFIHASSTHKKVIINKDPLSFFVKSTGRNTGIVLARARF